MKIIVVLKENNRDTFTVENQVCHYLDSILTNPRESKLEQGIVNHKIYDFLTKKNHYKLCPDSLTTDFANIALAAYSIDQIANRRKLGHYGWSRYIELNIPTYNLEKWLKVKDDFENTLSFLSGDKWVLSFRAAKNPFPSFSKSVFSPKKVSLFSGGMDSFIGITDLVYENDSIATISHHKGGNSGELRTQKDLINLLQKNQKKKEILPYYFYVQAKKNEYLTGEQSQRARSILFLALALLVANSSSTNTEIVIPENGLISLNLPLSGARGGSHSTKTTHPRFISSLNIIFKTVGINNFIVNPYKFKTKGEMLRDSKMPSFVSKQVKKTLSCSKPGYYRQWKKAKKVQCGHCVPCIIRRASFNLVNMDSAKDYVKDINEKGVKYSDFEAFKIGVKRYSNKEKIKIAFLKAGYMNISPSELKKYINMYHRGLKEVKELIKKQKN
jgi:7-cyano-7-deazaguanine synthase in queuosine biosynthesis